MPPAFTTGGEYLKTVSGILKFVEFIGSIIAVAVTAYGSALGSFFGMFGAAAIISIIGAIIFLILYLTAAVKQIDIRWYVTEFGFHLPVGVLYVGGIIWILAEYLAMNNFYGGSLGIPTRIVVGCVIAIIPTAAHFVDAFINFKKDPCC